MNTYLVCSKCGRREEYHHAKAGGWLIAGHKQKKGVMVIRCPKCITDYAKRSAAS